MVVLAHDLYDGAFIENKCWSVVFKDSPYDIINNVQFDVSNIKADANVEVGFGSTKLEITFDIAYKNAQENVNCFTNWFEDIYAPCCRHTGFKSYYADKAILYLYNGDNGKLLRKFILWKVYPIEVINEYCRDWNTVSFRATPMSIEDLTEEEKKMDDEKELSSILKKAQPYVELISLLDKVEEHIDKHGVPSSFESVGKEFAESLNRYNSILKDSCVGIMKDAYK